jgi:hydrogenase expression/formation protein HypC
MGKIYFGGVVREACLEALPEAKVGEYTIIHAGFALSILTEEEAQSTLEALRELADIEAELAQGDSTAAETPLPVEGDPR